jgi:hypothetical protein
MKSYVSKQEGQGRRGGEDGTHTDDRGVPLVAGHAHLPIR